MQLEHEAGVVVEAAAERGRELDARDIDAARGEEAGAALEQVERGSERDLGFGRERAKLGGGFVGIARHRQKFFDQGAGLARQRVGGAERGLLEEALGDLADRAAADRADAGDREQVGDQRARAFRIGAGQRREHALVLRLCVGGGEREHIKVVRERGLAVEVLHQAALPRRREIERRDQRGEQPDVAEADFRRRHAVVRDRLEAERQHLGVGRRLVGAAERLDAGLQELRRRRPSVSEDGSEVAEVLPENRPRKTRGSRRKPE